KPSHKATIVDITCDSDGCLDTFVDRADVKTALDLHVPNNEPYYIGFFLVGAYQESLANEHNLFGAIHEAEIYINADGDWEITKVTKGDPIDELLESRNYDLTEIAGCYELQFNRAIAEGRVEAETAKADLERLNKYMRSYPYLVDR